MGHLGRRIAGGCWASRLCYKGTWTTESVGGRISVLASGLDHLRWHKCTLPIPDAHIITRLDSHY